MTEQARDAVIASVNLMAEGNRLDRRAVPKIQRQNVHEGQDGDKGDRSNNQRAKKVGYFHVCLPGETDDRTAIEGPFF